MRRLHLLTLGILLLATTANRSRDGRTTSFPRAVVEARNPCQAWSTRFDDTGFTTTPDRGGWSWGLELVSYGVAGSERPVASAAPVKEDSRRVRREWGGGLTEWYVDEESGLEHGFTIESRPGAGEGALHLTLAVRGGLAPTLDTTGRNAAFGRPQEPARVTYTGLTVFDANEARVPARFEADGGRLCIAVDDRGAKYPLTVDPVAQQAYVKASNAQASDIFGFALAVSGGTAVVGARLEDSSATGVNGDQADNGKSASGAVYVFVRNGLTWSQQAYLKASNTDADDSFGWSVAISGNTIVVGAPFEASNATGVNGDQSDNSSFQAGAAYVFVRNGTTWSQEAYLKASNAFSGDLFGTSVAISGDTIVVGASGEDSNATGVNGNQSNNDMSSSGAAYVFVRSGTTWNQQAYVKASNPGINDIFGDKAALSGDIIIVSGKQEDSNATGVNGDQSNNSAVDSGAAYVFRRSGTTWSQEAYLKASNTAGNDSFGYSVAASGNTVAVGATLEDSESTGVNGSQADGPNGGNSGAAYVFVRIGSGTWTQQAYVKATNTGLNDQYGNAIALSGNVLVVGCEGEDSSTTGVNGNQASNGALNSGATYVYTRSGATWTPLAYLKASNTAASDSFGYAVGASGDSVIVAAHQEDSSATGVNGNQADNGAGSSGAAYVFDLDIDEGVLSYGTGTAGCAGVQTLGVNQAPMINSPAFAFTCDNAPPSSLGLCLVANAQDAAGSDPFGIGVLLHVNLFAATEVLAFDFPSDALGSALTTGTGIPNDPFLVGQTYYAQALWVWATCALPPFDLSTSKGLAITIRTP